MTQTKVEKFVPAYQTVDADVDVLLVDIREGMWQLDQIIDEALTHNEVIHVVSEDDAGDPTPVAEALNEMYNQEHEKVQEAQKQLKGEIEMENNTAKEMVNNAIEESLKKDKEVEKAQEEKNKAALAFLAKNSGSLKNAQKAPSKKEEPATESKKEANEEIKEETTNTKGDVNMNNTTTMGSRRRLSAGSTKGSQNEKQTKTNEEVSNMNNNSAVKSNRRRLSAGNTNTQSMPSSNRRRRLAHNESATNTNTFVPFEGPWYLNADLYPALKRFESIVADMRDDELGVTDIRIVNPASMPKYDNKKDVIVVVQMLFGGQILEFPIKENKSHTSKADLTSTSIGWVNTKNGMRPAFGFWRSNSPIVEVKCSCGNKFETTANNVYCRQCRTRHDDVQVSGEHALEFGFQDAVFQTIPNMRIPRDVLALAMAVAQYAEGFDMHGVVAE